MRFLILALVVSNLTLASPMLFRQWLVTPLQKVSFETPQQRTRPVVVGDILYYGNTYGQIGAVHRTGGYTLWARTLGAGIEGALAYGRSKIIVGDLQGNLYALNARDGSDGWAMKISSEWLSAPLILRDKVFAATSSDELYALSEKNGAEVWHYSHRGDEKMTIRGTSGPCLYGDTVFQGFSDGTVAALSAEKGKLLWSKRLKSRERFYDVDMTPYADDQGVLVSTFDGKFYSLDRNSGSTQWVFPTGSYSTPWVEEGKVYIAGIDKHFYALDRATGAVVWKTPYKEGLATGPAKAGEYLVSTVSSGEVYLLNLKTGAVVAKDFLGTPGLAAPAGSPDGWFFVLSNYGNLISYETREDHTVLGPQTVLLPSAVVRQLGEPRKNQNPS